MIERDIFPLFNCNIHIWNSQVLECVSTGCSVIKIGLKSQYGTRCSHVQHRLECVDKCSHVHRLTCVDKCSHVHHYICVDKCSQVKMSIGVDKCALDDTCSHVHQVMCVVENSHLQRIYALINVHRL